MAIKKSLVLVLIAALLVINFFSQASAQKVTGSIGNSRMILRLETGESIKRNILVRNVNDASVTINITTSGELADYIKLDEDSLILSPGEEKKVDFTLTAAKEGTTESKINILFIPETGNGVGLSSTIIVIASGADSVDNSDSSSTDENTSSGFSFNIGNQGGSSAINSGKNSQEVSKVSPFTLLLILSGVLILVLIALIIFASKRKSKKRSGRPRE